MTENTKSYQNRFLTPNVYDGNPCYMGVPTTPLPLASLADVLLRLVTDEEERVTSQRTSVWEVSWALSAVCLV